MGVEKVSTWYCPDCDLAMGRMADLVLMEVNSMSEGMPDLTPTAHELLTGDFTFEDVFPADGPRHTCGVSGGCGERAWKATIDVYAAGGY